MPRPQPHHQQYPAAPTSAGHQQPSINADCPPGNDALLQDTGGVIIRDLADMTETSTREADSMFLDEVNANTYKIFTNENQARLTYQRFLDAREAGINVPRGLQLFMGKIRRNNECRNVWILKMDYVRGKSFQLAKAGGPKVLFAMVSTASNLGTIRQSIRQLLVAYRYGLTDPQGFFVEGENPPVVFIDIHRGSVGSVELYSLACRLNECLAEKGQDAYKIDQNGKIL